MTTEHARRSLSEGSTALPLAHWLLVGLPVALALAGSVAAGNSPGPAWQGLREPTGPGVRWHWQCEPVGPVWAYEMLVLSLKLPVPARTPGPGDPGRGRH